MLEIPYGNPADRFSLDAGQLRNGTHVAVIRFTYEHGPRNISHQREMIRLGDLNKMIDDLTALAEKLGLR